MSRYHAPTLALLLVIIFLATPASAATPVNTCGDVLTQPGTYRLTTDLVCSQNPAISIAGSGVRLNLAGHSISCSDGGNGIHVTGADNKIKNGLVSGCNIAVSLQDTHESTVNGMTVINNSVGIFLVSSNDNRVSGNEANSNLRTAIVLSQSNRNRILNNQANFNQSGIGWVIQFDGESWISDSNYNFVACNETNHNEVTGIAVGGPATGNEVRNNVANYNGNDGIVAFGIDGTAFGIPDSSIPSGNTFKDNTAFGNVDEDLMEALFDPTAVQPPDGDPDRVVGDCMNEWNNNAFGESQGPAMCFGAPGQVDDHDNCGEDDDNDN